MQRKESAKTSGSVSSRACTRSLVTNQINTYEKVKLYILLGTLPFVEAFFPRVADGVKFATQHGAKSSREFDFCFLALKIVN